MSKIFKFRVVADSDDDIFRDIEINSSATFLEFHEEILKAFEFDNQEMASFYLSNEYWDKGDEIAMEQLDDSEGAEPAMLMHNTTLLKVVKLRNQKLVYVYDFLNMWCFYVELMNISDEIAGTTYPRVALSYGTSPKKKDKANFMDCENMFEEDLQYDDEDFVNDEDLDDEFGGDGDMFEGFDDFEKYN